MVESQTELALKSLSLSQSTDAFLSNKHKRDKYHIGMTLSEGHFATVKQCEEKATGKEHVLRVINKAKVFGQEDLILREVTIMKMLRQENVMQVLDHWETTDDMYLVIEQIEVRKLGYFWIKYHRCTVTMSCNQGQCKSSAQSGFPSSQFGLISWKSPLLLGKFNPPN